MAGLAKMIFTRIQLVLLAEAESLKQEIDPAIVCSVIEVMSAWHPELIMASTDNFNPGLSFGTQEEKSINGSNLGLLQFSGSQARTLGYKQNADGLLAPEINMEIGVKILRQCLAQANNNLARALTLMYGYKAASLAQKVFSKIPNFTEFLSSPLRPEVTM